jgi:hypothetical protein
MIVKNNLKSKRFIRVLCLIAAAWGGLALFLANNDCFAQQDFEYDGQGKRDPFIQLVTSDGRFVKLEHEAQAKPEDVKISLEGIIYDKYGISYAVVNGSIVKIGDSIGEYTVLKIQERVVVFIQDGQIKEISLKKED